jgi:hypothetical protein
MDFEKSMELSIDYVHHRVEKQFMGLATIRCDSLMN